ncbi:hypothetical protein GM3708_938 [Geminocystis sp. NIES-3708]|uniref:hypothetical protein n=1 Tax=Geminocystis sp. NIES-3708 TaxID=1615909 RepID=UPI0005FC80F2|nr:hypothetical protein [Geminocystis sp. NIES-3708]BAQ60532.1 hypothetical protein GM3708_938 [Geminocystis sp. NIES-3708]
MIPLTCVTVEKFFQEANWQGFKLIHDNKTPSTEKILTEETTPIAHFGLTVESFFSLHNWQGIFKTYQHQTETVEKEEELLVTKQPSYPLTMSVGEFFQRMAWQGQNYKMYKKTNIASMPKMSDVINLKPQVLNVKDLSDLL